METRKIDPPVFENCFIKIFQRDIKNSRHIRSPENTHEKDRVKMYAINTYRLGVHGSYCLIPLGLQLICVPEMKVQS